MAGLGLVLGLEAGAGGRGHAGVAAHQAQVLERHQRGDHLRRYHHHHHHHHYEHHLQVPGEEPGRDVLAGEARHGGMVDHPPVLGLRPQLCDDLKQAKVSCTI